MYKLIQYYGEKEGSPIDAEKWVDLTSNWFKANIEIGSDEEDFVNIVMAYFEAWKRTSNTDPHSETGQYYTDYFENNRWGKFINPETGKSKYTQLFNSVWFDSIVELFPQCFSMVDFTLVDMYEDRVNAFFEILKPCQPIDGADVQSWKLISKHGTKYSRLQSHIYWWMSWAVDGYNRTGVLVKPNEAWNVWDDQGQILSDAGKGFFSEVNTNLFSGILEVSDVPEYGNQIEGMKIKFLAEGFANESMKKNIIFTCVDENGQKLTTKSTTDKLVYKEQIGLSHRTETFGKKKRDTFGIRIQVRSGNLFTGEPPVATSIFEQTYTLEELRQMDGTK